MYTAWHWMVKQAVRVILASAPDQPTLSKWLGDLEGELRIVGADVVVPMVRIGG